MYIIHSLLCRPTSISAVVAGSRMALPTLQSLFDSPVKDYTLISKCGRRIEVHRCVLCLESKMFKNLFSNKEMKDENEIQTDVEYDDLMIVVKWMYGFKTNGYELNIKSYDGVISEGVYMAADKLMIDKLLDWQLYITINDKYLVRYVNIHDGSTKMNLIEERNIDSDINSIKDKVAEYVINRNTIVTGGTVNTKFKYEPNDDILYYLPTSILKKWFDSRYRSNSESDMIWFLHIYSQLHPGQEDVIKRDLVPGIRISCLSANDINWLFTKYGIIVSSNDMLLSTHKPTYQYVLYRMYTDSNKTTQFATNMYSYEQTVYTMSGIGVKINSILSKCEYTEALLKVKAGAKSLEYVLNTA